MRRDVLSEFRLETRARLEEGIRSAGYPPENVEAQIVLPPREKGDFAFPCFALAKQARSHPAAMAKAIAEAMPPSGLVSVSAEGPYVNVRIEPAVLAEKTLEAVRHWKGTYGHGEPNGVRLLLEHTSANPTGPLHVGRARNPIIGDTFGRILRAAGYDVRTEYYVNDVGRQVVTMAWGVANVPASELPEPERDKPDYRFVAAYQKASGMAEADLKVKAAIDGWLSRFEAGDAEIGRRVSEVVRANLDAIYASLARLGVRFDADVFESRFVRDAAVQRLVERLRTTPEAGTEGGASFIDMTRWGIAGKSQKFFLTRSDGTTLYTTRDIAYHADKLSRADRVVNVLGEDQKLAMRQLAIALELLGEKRAVETLFYAFVSLPEGRMSTRAGRVVYLDDLLDEAVARARAEVEKRRSGELDASAMQKIAEMVGIAALRFNIVKVQPEKTIQFRWEEALDFEGDSAPFVQYAHARSASILRKARADGLAASGDGKLLTHPEETALVRQLAALPRTVREAADGARPHPVALYALGLAQQFNQFYRDCPVLTAPSPELVAARLGLVDATRQVLANALDLLGISAPDAM
ncbi:MAG: arginine--tRNA ligase [Methanobacteriota archaeon]